MTKRKMTSYYVYSPDGTMEYTEALSPEQALVPFYKPDDFDPEEQFLVFESKDATVFSPIPSSWKEEK